MYTKELKLWISKLKKHEIFLAKDTYFAYFTDVKEPTFYQLIARLCDKGYIGKISKGLYYKPSIKDPSEEPPIESILEFLTNKGKSGMIAGIAMLNARGYVNDVPQDILIYSSLFDIKTSRVIKNLKVKEVRIDYKNDLIKETVCMLEMLENISLCSDINEDALYNFMKRFSENYDQKILTKVLTNKSYKKRVIYGLKIVLDYFGVDNYLNRYLNTASIYAFPKSLDNILKTNRELNS